MKPLQMLLCAGLLLVGGAGRVPAQQAEVHATDTINPADLGIRKWVFEAKAKPGSVVVFRERAYRENKLERTYELIIHRPGETCSASVLLLDHDFLSGESGSGNYTVKADCTGGTLARRVLHNAIFGSCGQTPDQQVMIGFATNKDEMLRDDKPQKVLRLEYDLRTEDYETLKKRIPDLPTPDSGFVWYKQDPDPKK